MQLVENAFIKMISNSVCMTCFWNNLHQKIGKPNNLKVFKLGTSKPKDLSRIVKNSRETKNIPSHAQL